MKLLNQHTGLYTDHYELTMAQGYFLSGKKNTSASFDYFFRKSPFSNGFVIFSGLSNLLETLEDFQYVKEDCEYLLSIGFNKKFVDYLKGFSFRGSIYSVNEGEIIFPQEPVLRVEGDLIELQLIETLLLNFLNFESLIATKAARMRLAAGDKILIDFGLRRAHGLGGIEASRSAIVGGFNKTSNVYSSHIFDLESTGTMAHSWVQVFQSELEAFESYSEKFPDNCILLVDTYNTLKSGMPNAIKVAKRMESQNKRLFGIRLDSGDLAYLSKEARKMLDKEGLHYVKIVASNQLNEFVIKSLLTDQQAPIDAFGVGTSLVTGQNDPALDGVYKLSEVNGRATLKISENQSKTTLPGRKEIFRFHENSGCFYADAISLVNENKFETIHHPVQFGKHINISKYQKEKIIFSKMVNGKVEYRNMSPQQSANYAKTRLELLPGAYKRLIYPHIYKVGLSSPLMDLRKKIESEIKTFE